MGSAITNSITKAQAIKRYKDKLKTLVPDALKYVKRGIVPVSAQYPYVLIRVPITEKYTEQSSGKTLAHVKSMDLLFDVVTQPKNDSNENSVDDSTIDELVEIIREKLDEVPDGQTIIGHEWQHEEEFLGEDIQGMTIFYTVQFINRPKKASNLTS